jgi:hypothetical protein
MTQPDPWASAGAAPAATATRVPPAQGYGNPAPEPAATAPHGSSLVEGYAPAPAKQSSLFGPTVETLPSLFTIAHAPGTRIKGKITAEPRDVHSTCHPSQAPDKVSRLKQYWVTDPQTGQRRPGISPVDAITGKPNDPVMNLVLSMETDERDPQIPGDDGRRSWFIQGSAKAPKGHVLGNPVLSARRALMDALQLAGESGVSITCDKDMVGKFIEVHRVQRENPAVSTSSWFWQARITAA